MKEKILVSFAGVYWSVFEKLRSYRISFDLFQVFFSGKEIRLGCFKDPEP